MPNLSLSQELLEQLTPPRLLTEAVLSDCLSIRHPSEVPFLQPEHFRLETDRAAWKALQELEASGTEPGVETLSEYLKRTAHVDYVDWWAYCINLLTNQFHLSILNFEDNARLVYDYAMRRKQAYALLAQIDVVFDLSMPLAESGLVSMNGVVHTLEEAFENLPPTNWLVENILAPGTVVLLYGKQATKKTYSMFSLASCLANGVDWLGFKTRKAAVLIVDQESTDRRIRLRLRECTNGVGGEKTAPIAWVTMQGYKLNNPADVAKIKQFIIEHHIELVIIDSLSKHMDGDENSVKDTALAMDGARTLSVDPDTVVLMIHHSQKSGEQFRGSSAIAGSVDMMIRVESEEGSMFVNFTMEKNRDGELLKWSARVHWVQLEGEPEKDQFTMERAEGRKEEGGEKELSAAEQYVMDYLREHGQSERQAIMNDAKGCSKYSARDALYSLVEAGKVRKTNTTSGGKDHPALYALSDENEQQLTLDDSGQ